MGEEAPAHILAGIVEEGKGLGRTLGFPTANLRVGDAPLPERGVYAARAQTPHGTYPAVVNIGSHPTFPEGPDTVEAYLLEYEGNLYGQSVTLCLGERLRPEFRFPSREALIEQIGRDAARARAIYHGKESV